MKIVLPGYDVPLVLQGGVINPVWYEFFNNLMKRGVLDAPDVNASGITNGQVLAYDDTSKKLIPAAN